MDRDDKYLSLCFSVAFTHQTDRLTKFKGDLERLLNGQKMTDGQSETDRD